MTKAWGTITKTLGTRHCRQDASGTKDENTKQNADSL